VNFILNNENAIYYACGYSCDNALYLSLGSEAYFITDSRYRLDAMAGVKGAEVLIDSDLYGCAVKCLKKTAIKKLHFDPKEWSVYGFESLQKAKGITLVPRLDLSHRQRIIKSERELKLLKEAAIRGKKAFNRFANYLREEGIGKREEQLGAMAEQVLIKEGKYALSFDPIVAVGANAAKPHAMPTKRRLKRGDLLLVDAGIKYKRYCSDRTRTVVADEALHFGISQHFSHKKIQKAYDAVHKAHDHAIAKARSGMRAKQVDALARDLITKAGFGEYFVHSTGHGVGLDIHEMPYISANSKTRIEDGMVYTIEPGIYIPDAFGIRIEDMVAMVEGRAVVL